MSRHLDEYRRRKIELEAARRKDPRLLGLPRKGSPEEADLQRRLKAIREPDRSKDGEIPF